MAPERYDARRTTVCDLIRTPSGEAGNDLLRVLRVPASELSGDRRRMPSLNNFGTTELFLMPSRKPTTGPMKMQPTAYPSAAPIPMMPGKAKASKAERKPASGNEAGAAKARITRRNSLRKQREVLKAKNNPGFDN